MKRTLSVILEKEPGALVRIISMINRRRFKLESFTVGGCESKYYDRLIIVIRNDNYQEQIEGDSVLQLARQLRRLINVLEVIDITFISKVQRELLLIKIKVDRNERSEIVNLMKVFRFKIVDMSPSMIILEISGDPGKINALEEILIGYDIIELIRTGKIGLIRDSLISTNTVTQFPMLNKRSLAKRYNTHLLPNN
uniref:acetolactate synthase small subunit n=1 Tax=Phaeostrophion irregulare TaxID=243268 RepID=UPI002E788221|nr:acetolactate synthase small subunit [Phaeostrophion irregulare]WAM64322.1 acetolactate synthase small subunit [Phaeostrophion irregulare]